MFNSFMTRAAKVGKVGRSKQQQQQRRPTSPPSPASFESPAAFEIAATRSTTSNHRPYDDRDRDPSPYAPQRNANGSSSRVDLGTSHPGGSGNLSSPFSAPGSSHHDSPNLPTPPASNGSPRGIPTNDEPPAASLGNSSVLSGAYNITLDIPFNSDPLDFSPDMFRSSPTEGRQRFGSPLAGEEPVVVTREFEPALAYLQNPGSSSSLNAARAARHNRTRLNDDAAQSSDSLSIADSQLGNGPRRLKAALPPPLKIPDNPTLNPLANSASPTPPKPPPKPSRLAPISNATPAAPTPPSTIATLTSALHPITTSPTPLPSSASNSTHASDNLNRRTTTSSSSGGLRRQRSHSGIPFSTISRPSSLYSDAGTTISHDARNMYTRSFLFSNDDLDLDQHPSSDARRDSAAVSTTGLRSARQSSMYQRFGRQDSATLPRSDNPLVNSPYWDKRASMASVYDFSRRTSAASGFWTPERERADRESIWGGRLSPYPGDGGIPPVPPLPLFMSKDEDVPDPSLRIGKGGSRDPSPGGANGHAKKAPPPALALTPAPAMLNAGSNAGDDKRSRRISRISEAPSPVPSASDIASTNGHAHINGNGNPNTLSIYPPASDALYPPAEGGNPMTPLSGLETADPDAATFLTDFLRHGAGGSGTGNTSAHSASSFPNSTSSPSAYSGEHGQGHAERDKEREREREREREKAQARDSERRQISLDSVLGEYQFVSPESSPNPNSVENAKGESSRNESRNDSRNDSRNESRYDESSQSHDDFQAATGSSSSLLPLGASTVSVSGTRQQAGSAAGTTSPSPGRQSVRGGRDKRGQKPISVTQAFNVLTTPASRDSTIGKSYRPSLTASKILLPIGSDRRKSTLQSLPGTPNRTLSFGPQQGGGQQQLGVNGANSRLNRGTLLSDAGIPGTPDILGSVLEGYMDDDSPNANRLTHNPSSFAQPLLESESEATTIVGSPLSGGELTATTDTSMSTPTAGPTSAGTSGSGFKGGAPSPIAIPNIPTRFRDIAISGTPVTAVQLDRKSSTASSSTSSDGRQSVPVGRPASEAMSAESHGQTFPETPHAFSPLSDTFSPYISLGMHPGAQGGFGGGGAQGHGRSHSRMTMPPIVVPIAGILPLSSQIAVPNTALPSVPEHPSPGIVVPEVPAIPSHLKTASPPKPGALRRLPPLQTSDTALQSNATAGAPPASPPIISPLLPPELPVVRSASPARPIPAPIPVAANSVHARLPSVPSSESINRAVPRGTPPPYTPSPDTSKKVLGPRPRTRLPLGPRNPTPHTPGPPTAGPSTPAFPRTANGTSTPVAVPTPPHSRKGSVAHTLPPLPSFQTAPVRWKGHTMDAAKWTFSSKQLQGIVSRAIKQSAEASSIRLLPPDVMDDEIPAELERLSVRRDELVKQYQSQVRVRRDILASLSKYSLETDSADMGNHVRLTTDLMDVCKSLDQICEDIYFVDDQLAQVNRLRDTHSASALAMALRKLNTSFLKQVSETQALRQQVQALEAEKEEAWMQAQELARDLDDLNDRIFEESEPGTASGSVAGGLSRSSSRRSNNIHAVRKTSTRAAKAGLRSSLYRRSDMSSRRGSSVMGSAARSTFSSEDVPPVPPIPSSGRPSIIRSDYDRGSKALPSSASSDTRAMAQAHKEVMDMLGISMNDLTGQPSRPQSFSPVSRGASPTLGRSPSLGRRPRRGSLPGAPGDMKRESDELTHNRQAVLAMLTLPPME